VELLRSKNFQALGPGQLILDPTLVSGDFGYRLLSWQALEKDLDLRRQLMEGSSDIVELTPDLAAPTQGRVETGRNAYLIACGCQAVSLQGLDRKQLLPVFSSNFVRPAFGLVAESQDPAGPLSEPRWPRELWTPKGDETLFLVARRLQALAASFGSRMEVRAVDPAELDSQRRAGTAPPCLLRWRRIQADAGAAMASATAALGGPDPAGRGLQRGIVPLLFVDARYWIADHIGGVRLTDFGLLDLSRAHRAP
jgi:hypothetical protein